MAIEKFETLSSSEGRKRFLFVVASSKTEADYASRNDTFPLFNCLSRMSLDDVSVDVETFLENKFGLSELYNSSLERFKDKYDFFVLLHDDVWPNDVMMFDKIIAASSEFDVIGCCGGKGWEMLEDRSKPMIWTHAARNAGASGFMVHAGKNGEFSEREPFEYRGKSVFATNYGKSPSSVLTVDGSFMCLTAKAVADGVRFDPMFKFHFYDMDMCFTAFVLKERVGTAPLLVTHESLGYSVMQPEFMESQKKFIDKWFRGK